MAFGWSYFIHPLYSQRPIASSFVSDIIIKMRLCFPRHSRNAARYQPARHDGSAVAEAFPTCPFHVHPMRIHDGVETGRNLKHFNCVQRIEDLFSPYSLFRERPRVLNFGALFQFFQLLVTMRRREFDFEVAAGVFHKILRATSFCSIRFHRLILTTMLLPTVHSCYTLPNP